MANYDGKIRSLCISYGGWYYRVADYIDSFGKFQSINYKEGKIRNRLYMNPKEKIHEHKPVLKEWYDNGDTTKVLPGIKNIGKIYEIISIYGENYNGCITYNEEQIIEKLSEGFHIPNIVEDEFLLYVGMKEEYLITILCKRKYLKKDKTKDNFYYLDIDENNRTKKINYLSSYKILKEEIISTDNLTGSFEVKALIGNDRYFYESMELPQDNGKILIREIDSLIIEFISKWIGQKTNILSITDNDKNNLIKVLNKYLEDEIEIKNLMNITDLSYEKILETINLLLQPILKVYSGEDEINNLVEDYLLRDSRIYNKCIKKVKEEWLLLKDLEKEEKEKEIDELYQIISLNKEKNNDIEYKIEDNKKIFDSLLKKINELEDKKINIELEIEEQLINFKSNIVETTKIFGIFESNKVDNIPKLEIRDEKCKNLLYIKSEKLEKKEKYVDDNKDNNKINSFFESLENNFSDRFSGSKNIAKSIISSILMKKAIIIDEYLGREIADNISMVLSAATADYICITSNEISIELLINIINKCSSKVIYIDGLLDLFNYNIFTAIHKNCKNKCIVFGVSEENVKDLPRNIWKHAIYTGYSDRVKNIKPKEKVVSTNDILNFYNEEIFKNINNKEISILYEDKLISKVNEIELTYYYEIMKKIKNEASQSDFINNLYLLAKDEKRKDLREVLCELDFSEEVISKSFFGDEG